MKTSLKIALLTAISALFIPLSASAATLTLSIQDFPALKKAMKEMDFTADAMTLKKAQFGALKKIRAVESVDKDATSVPTTAYMKALEKAMDTYLSARSKAGSNKKKIDAAEAAYTQAIADATELYLIPNEVEQP